MAHQSQVITYIMYRQKNVKLLAPPPSKLGMMALALYMYLLWNGTNVCS